MDSHPVASWPRRNAKWCAYALVLLTPGSFIFLPILVLIRFLVRSEGNSLSRASRHYFARLRQRCGYAVLRRDDAPCLAATSVSRVSLPDKNSAAACTV